MKLFPTRIARAGQLCLYYKTDAGYKRKYIVNHLQPSTQTQNPNIKDHQPHLKTSKESKTGSNLKRLKKRKKEKIETAATAVVEEKKGKKRSR